MEKTVQEIIDEKLPRFVDFVASNVQNETVRNALTSWGRDRDACMLIAKFNLLPRVNDMPAYIDHICKLTGYVPTPEVRDKLVRWCLFFAEMAEQL